MSLSSLIKSLPTDAIFAHINSPVGDIALIASKSGLHAILWESNWASDTFKTAEKWLKKDTAHPVIQKTSSELAEYFAGKRKTFTIPLVTHGTDFQKHAWKTLSNIPYGKTISYEDQAIQMGDKNKVRAVGGANGRNPHSIIVPCHRVIGKNGSLTGFGGGVSIKQYLLEHEARILNQR